MKNKKQIQAQRDVLIEYLESTHQEEYLLTSRLFTVKEIEAQVMAFNWVLNESKRPDKEKMIANTRKRIEEALAKTKTTIQIGINTRDSLTRLKAYPRETYEDVLERILRARGEE